MYIEHSERSCIRNTCRSGVGRAEQGLVSRKDGVGRRAGFERVCIRDTAGVDRG